MTLIDTLVVTIIIAFGLFILYQPLKEPIDMFFGFIKSIFVWIKDQISGVAEDATVEVIRYG
jgi:hypothetical protein|tara:strand:+ start:2123 stop:2308 length:186 start_codon:yes stop_codon:yes gene_type:complete